MVMDEKEVEDVELDDCLDGRQDPPGADETR